MVLNINIDYFLNILEKLVKPVLLFRFSGLCYYQGTGREPGLSNQNRSERDQTMAHLFETGFFVRKPA